MPSFTIYLHQKLMQKKSEIKKKCNFLGQALDFLLPRKPGLYISCMGFFFKYRKWTLSSGQDLSKLVKILLSLTKFRNLSRNHSMLCFAGRFPMLIYQVYDCNKL